jgi:5-methylcytosine-specific restriction endonuclease McrA
MNNQLLRGLCIFCTEKRFGDSALCEKHYFNSIATSNLKDRTKGDHLKEIFFAQNSKCYYSGRELIAGKNASIDHLFPISTHPELANSIENIRWCDKQVNHAKNNMDYTSFINLCGDIVKYTKPHLTV